MISHLVLAQTVVSAAGERSFISNVPDWLWLFVGGVAGAAVLSVTYALMQAAEMRRSISEIVQTFGKLEPLTEDGRLRGLTLEQVTEWRNTSAPLHAKTRGLTADLDRALVMVKDDHGKPRFFLRDADGSPWEERSAITRFVNLRLIDATPTLLTALGLIGTFTAIAWGLSELKAGPNGQILRVEGLLEGLSGKFITSIVALALAAVVQALDLILLRPHLSQQFARLKGAVEDAFPRISPAQQTAYLLESARRQENALANISSDMVDRFSGLFTGSLLPDLGAVLARSMQAEMGPSMEKVAESLRAVDEGIRRLENGKQESIGSELRALTASLERSLTESLAAMGADFRNALSGSAGREFDNASEALRSSADVLKGMNESFEAMQAMMARMLSEAERRAAASFEEGEGRTRALNELVERLVSQLNEAAHTSAAEVQRLLVEAVGGMSARLGQVSAELEERSRQTADESLRANRQLVDEVTGAAGRTSAETERLLAALGERSGDFIAAADQLRELREGVSQVLAQTTARVREMHEAATAFRTVAVEAANLTRSLRETQDQQRQTTETASGTVTRVGGIVERQAEIVDASSKSFKLAQDVFGDLDERLATALRVLLEQMQNYNVQVEKNFEIILGRVNRKLPELFERLEASLTQVADLVGDLTDAVDRLRPDEE